MDVFLSLWPALAAGLVAGATVAFPLGPMGQLGARLQAEHHRRAARQVAFTCVGMDSLMAAVALVSLSFLPTLPFGWHPWLLGLVGAALVLLGAVLWQGAPHTQPGELPGGFTQPWRCALAYTLLHPGALLTFLAAFGALHAHGVFAHGGPDKLATWLGVTLGAAGVWFAWLLFIRRLRHAVAVSRLRLLFARGLALTLIGAGALLLWESRLLHHVGPALVLPVHAWEP